MPASECILSCCLSARRDELGFASSILGRWIFPLSTFTEGRVRRPAWPHKILLAIVFGYPFRNPLIQSPAPLSNFHSSQKSFSRILQQTFSSGTNRSNKNILVAGFAFRLHSSDWCGWACNSDRTQDKGSRFDALSQDRSHFFFSNKTKNLLGSMCKKP